MTNYTCKCGKTFSNLQQYRGHKSHCKVVHTLNGTLSDYLNRQNKACQSAVLKKTEIASDRRLKRELEWKLAEHKCERCGIVMTSKYGSGRFCSRSCANSKPHTEETKNKIRQSINALVQSGEIIPFCTPKKVEEVNQKHSVYSNSPNHCIICGKSLSYERRHCKTCGDSECINKAISDTHKRIHSEGNHLGWNRRLVQSYPERFWEQVLINNSIPYEREFNVSTSGTHYLLDFKLPGEVDLEIDGKQHTYADRVEHDKIRDERLANLGYTIYRIRWVNPVGESSEIVKTQINEFLTWYSSKFRSNYYDF